MLKSYNRIFIIASFIDDPLEVISIQILALRSSAYTDNVPLRSLCDKFVRLSISYEKSAPQGKYT